MHHSQGVCWISVTPEVFESCEMTGGDAPMIGDESTADERCHCSNSFSYPSLFFNISFSTSVSILH